MKNLKIFLLLVVIFIVGVCTFGCNFNADNKEDPLLLNDMKSEKPYRYSVILSRREMFFLLNNIRESKHYLEFGAGGSTFLALLYSNADVVSVESEKDWIKHMRKWKFIRKNEKDRLKFYYVYTGKMKGWGWPVDEEKSKHLFPKYSKGVFKKYHRDYDLVFIDGRFRVACALQSILNTNEDTKIMIHDFTDRKEYHVLLQFLDIEQTVDTMVLLKKKKNINYKDVEKMYEEYKYELL